jgi:hypothetical protein
MLPLTLFKYQEQKNVEIGSEIYIIMMKQVKERSHSPYQSHTGTLF